MSLVGDFGRRRQAPLTMRNEDGNDAYVKIWRAIAFRTKLGATFSNAVICFSNFSRRVPLFLGREGLFLGWGWSPHVVDMRTTAMA